MLVLCLVYTYVGGYARDVAVNIPLCIHPMLCLCGFCDTTPGFPFLDESTFHDAWF